METTQIEISWKELRALTQSVTQLVSDLTSEPRGKISLRTAINNDLQVQGDDWDEFLEKLYADYGVEFHGLDTYFIDEGQITDRMPVVFLFFLLKCLAFIFVFPIRKDLARKVWNASLFKKLPDLTVGDLIASVLTEKWTPRQQARVQLI